MCAHGTDVIVRLKVAADLSHTGESYWRDWGVDACIAPLVKALQDGGIDMRGSCCGHGKGPGFISLQDGRELTISAASTDEQHVEVYSERIDPATVHLLKRFQGRE